MVLTVDEERSRWHHEESDGVLRNWACVPFTSAIEATLDRRAADPLTVTVDEPEPPRAVRQRRILAAISTGAVLYGAHVSVWAIPMLLGAVAGALLFLVWQPQDRLRRLVRVWR